MVSSCFWYVPGLTMKAPSASSAAVSTGGGAASKYRFIRRYSLPPASELSVFSAGFGIFTFGLADTSPREFAHGVCADGVSHHFAYFSLAFRSGALAR